MLRGIHKATSNMFGRAVVGVILNLSIWFAIHTIFASTSRFANFGMGFDVPVFASINLESLGLTLAAALAVFRFKLGIVPTLTACCAAGVALQFAGLLTPAS